MTLDELKNIESMNLGEFVSKCSNGGLISLLSNNMNCEVCPLDCNHNRNKCYLKMYVFFSKLDCNNQSD